MFLDERGAGLRVTWHPERDLVVLSVWQDDSCVGTFRMAVEDVPRLTGLLAAALGDWVGQLGAGSGDHAGGWGGGTGGWRGRTGGWGGGTGGWGGRTGGQAGTAPGARDVSLSVRQRVRLSRPMLRLRGSWPGRRRSA
jgi:hypothetical protein